MVVFLAAIMQISLHYYWEAAPENPGWHYLMVGGQQAGAYDARSGLYYRRIGWTTQFSGPETPPFPPPAHNYGVREDKVMEDVQITRQGRPADRQAVLDAIDARLAPSRPWNAYSWLPAVAASAGLSAALGLIVFLRRRR